MTTSNGFYAGYKNSESPDTDFIVNLYTGVVYAVDDEQNARVVDDYYFPVRKRGKICKAIIADTETPEYIIPLFAGNNPTGNIIDFDPLTNTGIWEL